MNLKSRYNNPFVYAGFETFLTISALSLAFVLLVAVPSIRAIFGDAGFWAGVRLEEAIGGVVFAVAGALYFLMAMDKAKR